MSERRMSLRATPRRPMATKRKRPPKIQHLLRPSNRLLSKRKLRQNQQRNLLLPRLDPTEARTTHSNPHQRMCQHQNQVILKHNLVQSLLRHKGEDSNSKITTHRNQSRERNSKIHPKTNRTTREDHIAETTTRIAVLAEQAVMIADPRIIVMDHLPKCSQDEEGVGIANPLTGQRIGEIAEEMDLRPIKEEEVGSRQIKEGVVVAGHRSNSISNEVAGAEVVEAEEVVDRFFCWIHIILSVSNTMVVRGTFDETPINYVNN